MAAPKIQWREAIPGLILLALICAAGFYVLRAIWMSLSTVTAVNANVAASLVAGAILGCCFLKQTTCETVGVDLHGLLSSQAHELSPPIDLAWQVSR